MIRLHKKVTSILLANSLVRFDEASCQVVETHVAGTEAFSSTTLKKMNPANNHVSEIGSRFFHG